MNFFEHQRIARQRSYLLVFYFFLAVLLIAISINALVFLGWDLFITKPPGWDPLAPLSIRYFFWLSQPTSHITILSTILVIGVGSLFKILALRSEGSEYPATLLGGVEVGPYPQDPLEKRLRNVVEEMSIASGCPVPRIFILPREDGINAFASGTDPANAVVTVTQGLLERLNREQLQGVIAHEFSHIFNGDMRLNIQLLGVLNGILLLALTGRGILRAFAQMNTGRRSKNDNQGGAVLLYLFGLALVLMIIGYIGLLFGRLIKAAVSRQREFLADASAVQFTRNPEGLGGALSAIASAQGHGLLLHAQAEQFSHFYFSDAVTRWTSLFNTHPPLKERIARILNRPIQTSEVAPTDQRKSPDKMFGKISHEGLAFAGEMVKRFESTQSNQSEAADFTARVLALLFPEAKSGSQMANEISKEFDLKTAVATSRLADEGSSVSADEIMPLLDLSLVPLKNMPQERKIKLDQFIQAHVGFDQLSPHRACLLALTIMELNPPPVRIGKKIRFKELQGPIEVVLTIMARLGQVSEESAQKAFEIGMNKMFAEQFELPALTENPGTHLFNSLLELRQITHPEQRRRIVDACFKAAMFDNEINPLEYNILRATCAMVQTPMPPRR